MLWDHSLRRLCQYPPGPEDSSPLDFPSLQKLYWFNAHHFRAIRPFLSSSVTFVRVSLQEVAIGQSSHFLKTLSQHCPWLRYLDLSMPDDSSLASDLLEMLPSLHAIQEFRCEGITNIPITLLLPIATLPYLHALTLLAESISPGDDLPSTTGVSFGALKSLHLSTQKSCDWSQIFKYLHFPALDSILVASNTRSVLDSSPIHSSLW